MSVSINIIREICDEQNPNANINVKGYSDIVRVWTPDNNSQKWFGKVGLDISADVAEALGKALISAAKDTRDRSNES
jgi:hypothetical protein